MNMFRPRTNEHFGGQRAILRPAETFVLCGQKKLLANSRSGQRGNQNESKKQEQRRKRRGN